MKVTIVDYGLGNIGSLVNMIRKCGGTSELAGDVSSIERAQKIILPGVGAFDAGISSIERSGLREILQYKATEQQVPFLGICLGMQLLTNGSEEGELKGLGFVNGFCQRFPSSNAVRIPHMGWNEVSKVKASRYFISETEAARYYFVHSYYVAMYNEEDILLKSTYGIEFCAAFEKDNILGVQFHPEKSHRFGKQLFKSFLSL